MRKSTATTKAANAVIKATGKGWMKWNDRLKDGRRSLKVLGWTRKEYEMAKQMLDSAGHKTELVDIDSYNWRSGAHTVSRLRVKEI